MCINKIFNFNKTKMFMLILKQLKLNLQQIITIE